MPVYARFWPNCMFYVCVLPFWAKKSLNFAYSVNYVSRFVCRCNSLQIRVRVGQRRLQSDLRRHLRQLLLHLPSWISARFRCHQLSIQYGRFRVTVRFHCRNFLFCSVGGVAQWLWRQSLADGLSLRCARSVELDRFGKLSAVCRPT